MPYGRPYTLKEDAAILDCLKPVYLRLEDLGVKLDRTPAAMRKRYQRLCERRAALAKAKAKTGAAKGRRGRRAGG